MEIGDFLAITGLIATIVFGVLGIALVRRRKYPGHLSLVLHSSIGLFNNIAKNFQEISIRYKSNEINENVVYIKASIVNEGDIDIDGRSLEQNIALELEPNLIWIKAKVTKTSEHLTCSAIIDSDSNSVQFDLGLMKKKEFFQFEALIETSDGSYNAEKVYESIIAKHRIPNTKDIETTSLLNSQEVKHKRGRIRRMVILMVVYVAFLLVIPLVTHLFYNTVPILYQNGDSLYKTEAHADSTIKLINIKTDEERTINLVQLQAKNNYSPVVQETDLVEHYRFIWYFIPILVIMLLLLTINDFIELRKAKRLSKILLEDTND